MRIRYCRYFVVLALASFIFCGIASADAAPPEPTTKVKRVLLYNKIGGFINPASVQETKDVFAILARSKGFELDSLSDDTQLTSEYLKKYQVIIWNNNTNGAASVNVASAREAVASYVNEGGGWLLIHYAGDHGDTWPQLKEMLGTKFAYHTMVGRADLVADSSAKQHPELKHILSAVPGTIRLKDLWFHFENTVRPLAGVTVLFTAENSESGVVRPWPDSSGDRPMIWARTIGKGRLLYSGPGQGLQNVAAQADSAIPKLYWQSLRWLAGDFQNGCTDKQSPRYDSLARIDDGTCMQSTAIRSFRTVSKTPQIVARPGQRVRMDLSGNSDARITLRDLRGVVVFRRIVTAGNSDFLLDATLKAGMYQLEMINGSNSLRYSLVVQ